jgi:ElaB/YqjD/DUF883 family membrane-anchored ribosome-binding protein
METKAENGHDISMEQFLEDIKTVVRDGEKLLKVGMSEAKQKALAGARTTGKKAREYPYQTIGIVFGLGLLAGVLAAGLSSGASEEED